MASNAENASIWWRYHVKNPKRKQAHNHKTTHIQKHTKTHNIYPGKAISNFYRHGLDYVCKCIYTDIRLISQEIEEDIHDEILIIIL